MLLPLLCDPTDQIVQNEMTVFGVVYPQAFDYWVAVQGSDIMNPLGFPVPRAMVGQHEWYGLNPRKLGPKVLQPSGEIVFEPVGKFDVPVVIEPITAWINQNLGKQIGGYASMGPDIIGPAEATNSFILAADDPLDDFDTILMPRRAIALTNLAGKRVFPRMPASYFDKELVEGTMTETTNQWFITGQTLDSTSTALAGCTVYLMRADRVCLSPDVYGNPIIDMQVSDAGGNYSFQVSTPVDYQIMAYKPGGTDVAGITRKDVQAVMV